MKQESRILTLRNGALSKIRSLYEEEHASYEAFIKEKYNSEKARENLLVSRTGSSLFEVIELENQGIKVVNSSYLGLILEQHRRWLSIPYIHAPSVALTMAGDSYKPNDFLAKDLAKQLGIKKFENPIIVNGLRLEESKKSFYGLKFKVTDRTEFYEAPKLAIENNKRRFTEIDERSIPIFDEEGDKNGDKIFYTREGISGLCVGRGAVLDWGWSAFAYSTRTGKTIVIDPKGDSNKNLEKIRIGMYI